ncbi:hypothetical protein [Lysobacter brunescens]|uniref:VCBS repeat-containing protein n=1 Tax=Lysobacter brunescens TaxID=262323 RepID=A0ABW2YED2_9GAMM
MTRIAFPFAALSLAICGGLATSAAASAGYGLQPPGSFHSGEAVARSGERWLALRGQDDDTALVSVQVAVKRVHDPLVDAEGQATGEAVSAIRADDAIMLLRGAGLRAGAVSRASVAEQASEHGLPAYRIALDTREYRIATSCVIEDRNATASPTQAAAYACTIDLIDGERRQSLMSIAAYRESPDARLLFAGDASPHLIFAGDLDRDGRVDLILDTTDHYNLSRPTLFLSGAAGKGELLHAVATHAATGC